MSVDHLKALLELSPARYDGMQLSETWLVSASRAAGVTPLDIRAALQVAQSGGECAAEWAGMCELISAKMAARQAAQAAK